MSFVDLFCFYANHHADIIIQAVLEIRGDKKYGEHSAHTKSTKGHEQRGKSKRAGLIDDLVSECISPKNSTGIPVELIY